MDYQHAHHHSGTNRAFSIGIFLNAGYVIVEAVFGFLTGSLILLADAGHNASDVLGLVLAWAANLLAQRPMTRRHTYGRRSFTILAALINALILMVAVGGIAKQAIDRLIHPAPGLAGLTVIWVALGGIGVHLISAFFFRSERKKDLNVRGAFLHMASDAGISIGVIVAALLIRFTGWTWLDPVLSLAIAIYIFIGTWGLLRNAFHLLMGGTPRNIDFEKVHAYLSDLPGVENVHDLHVWGLSTKEVALTAHLVKPEPAGDDHLLTEAMQALHQRFDIDHVTLQWERKKLPGCG